MSGGVGQALMDTRYTLSVDQDGRVYARNWVAPDGKLRRWTLHYVARSLDGLVMHHEGELRRDRSWTFEVTEL